MINVEMIKNLFQYQNGNLIWLVSKGKAKKGQIAGSPDKQGYLIVRINGKAYKAHRLIFLLHKGYLPQFIDHIDRDPSNNCIENLREATNSQNQANSKLHAKNSSGYRGVSWHKTAKKWEARASINKKQKYLGCFDTAEEAHQACKLAVQNYFGEYANI